jgi:hypothetical protein
LAPDPTYIFGQRPNFSKVTRYIPHRFVNWEGKVLKNDIVGGVLCRISIRPGAHIRDMKERSFSTMSWPEITFRKIGYLLRSEHVAKQVQMSSKRS